MDIQAKKLQVIQEILSITNESVLEELVSVLRKEKFDPNLKNKLSSRALQSERDISEGRTMTLEKLESKLNAEMG